MTAIELLANIFLLYRLQDLMMCWNVFQLIHCSRQYPHHFTRNYHPYVGKSLYSLVALLVREKSTNQGWTVYLIILDTLEKPMDNITLPHRCSRDLVDEDEWDHICCRHGTSVAESIATNYLRMDGVTASGASHVLHDTPLWEKIKNALMLLNFTPPISLYWSNT